MNILHENKNENKNTEGSSDENRKPLQSKFSSKIKKNRILNKPKAYIYRLSHPSKESFISNSALRVRKDESEL